MTKLISKPEFAKTHDVSIRTVDNWIRDGLAIAVAKGKTTFIDSEKSEALLKKYHHRAGRPRAEEDADLKKMKLRKLKAEALTAEADYAERMGKLIPIDDATTIVTEELSIVRNLFLSLGSKMGPRLAGQNHSAERVKHLIDIEVNKILTELSSEDDLAEMAAQADANVARHPRS